VIDNVHPLFPSRDGIPPAVESRDGAALEAPSSPSKAAHSSNQRPGCRVPGAAAGQRVGDAESAESSDVAPSMSTLRKAHARALLDGDEARALMFGAVIDRRVRRAQRLALADLAHDGDDVA
jgi:hypothetical protein